MYELFYNTLEFLIAKTQPIEKAYVKYVPKVLRFILWPLTQVVLGLIVTISVFVAIIYKLIKLIKKAYNNYE